VTKRTGGSQLYTTFIKKLHVLQNKVYFYQSVQGIKNIYIVS